MALSTRIARHLRANVVGYLALFVALTATAWAAPKITSKQLGKNAVTSKHVKDGKIGNRDLADGSVNSAKVAEDALTGADIDESTLAQGPGAAPGWDDLTGVPAGFADDDDDDVPDLGEVSTGAIADGAVTSAKIPGDELTGGDIDEATLSLPAPAVAWDDLTGVPAGFADDDDDDLPDAGEVDGASIANGAITDDDISGTAAISDSKLATQMGVMTGRVNGLSSVDATHYAAASAFSGATTLLSEVTSLSPATPLEAGALSVELNAAPGPGNIRYFEILDDGGATGVACTVVFTGTTCTSGTSIATIAPSSELALGIVTSDGGALGDVGGTSAMFGWQVR